LPLLEPFSSAGPTPILINTSGTRLSTPVVRQKPEIVAPDGTNITFFGSDVILGRQVLANITPAQAIDLWTDVNGDGKVVMAAELFYALKKIAGLR
jgi:hypothetical protein